MEPKYLIPESLIKAIHDYLLSQPMRNVENLVSALRNAELEKPDDISTVG